MSTLIERRRIEWDLTMKSSLAEAVISVLKEHGFTGLRMDRVASAADVAKGTLYNYFKNKDDLLVYVMDKKFELILPQLLEIRDSNMTPPDKIGSIIRELMKLLEDEQGLILAVADAEGLSLPVKNSANVKREVIVRIIAGIIEEGIQKRIFRKFDTIQVAKLIFAAIHAPFRIEINGEDNRRAINDEVSDCVNLFLSGLMSTD